MLRYLRWTDFSSFRERTEGSAISVLSSPVLTSTVGEPEILATVGQHLPFVGLHFVFEFLSLIPPSFPAGEEVSGQV